MKDLSKDVLIIGGGLAGLTAALHLHKCGFSVVVIEKNSYPHHKVCGEYLSNEVIPYLNWLKVDLATLSPATITRFQLSSSSGKKLTVKLPLGGIGISRYLLDYSLYQQLLTNKIAVIQDTVTDVKFEDDIFTVRTQDEKIFTSKQVIGAYGKRALLDVKLDRLFIRKKSYFLAVKAHYYGDFPDDVVALHHFKGGYCGVSKVEDKRINICYLTDYETFKPYKNIETYQKNVLYKHDSLKQLFEESTALMDEPLTISQLYFDSKETVINHILMIGDTAGLIHPLCGNGMAMAIHSAKIVSTLLIDYHNGKISSRLKLEKMYTAQWKKEFGIRIKIGKIIASALRKRILTNFTINLLTKLPFLLRQIIKQTHGKPIIINEC